MLPLPLLSSLTFHPRQLHPSLFFFGNHAHSCIHPDSPKLPGITFIHFRTTNEPTHTLLLSLSLSLSRSHSLIAFCQLCLTDLAVTVSIFRYILLFTKRRRAYESPTPRFGHLCLPDGACFPVFTLMLNSQSSLDT